MSDNLKVAGSLLIGAVAGTVLGMLFAPKSGKELIARINTRADNLKSDFEYDLSKVREVFADFKATITNTPEQSSSNLKDEFNNAF